MRKEVKGATVLMCTHLATGQGLAGFIISRTEHVANSTYYYGLGVVTVAVAIILFVVAPWTERKMADVGVTSQD